MFVPVKGRSGNDSKNDNDIDSCNDNNNDNNSIHNSNNKDNLTMTKVIRMIELQKHW